MDTSRIAAPAAAIARLACPYGLRDVVDARTAGERAGGIGYKMFRFDDAPKLVREQLASAGFATADTARDAVTVRILKLYLAQNNVTKVPVVVYDVQVDRQPSFLVRSQLPTMNWANTSDEAYNAYARAFQDANAKLVAKLNAQCASRK